MSMEPTDFLRQRQTPPYRQCQLERATVTGVGHHTAWLPSEVALVGKQVRFRDTENDPWSEVWLVVYAGEERPAEVVESADHEWKHHRASKTDPQWMHSNNTRICSRTYEIW